MRIAVPSVLSPSGFVFGCAYGNMSCMRQIPASIGRAVSQIRGSDPLVLCLSDGFTLQWVPSSVAYRTLALVSYFHHWVAVVHDSEGFDDRGANLAVDPLPSV